MKLWSNSRDSVVTNRGTGSVVPLLLALLAFGWHLCQADNRETITASCRKQDQALVKMLEKGDTDAAKKKAEDVYSTRRSRGRLRKAAEQGRAYAQRILGFVYQNGLGDAWNRDEEETVRKTAKRGDAWSQYYLGLRYEYGWGARKDQQEALKWIRKAAEQGFPRACYELAKLIELTTGNTHSHDEAVKWYQKAAEQGIITDGCNPMWDPLLVALSEPCQMRAGVSKDRYEAWNWYSKAAAQGYAPAMFFFGLMCREHGHLDEAAKWLRKAADQGHQRAREELKKIEHTIRK